MFQDVPYHWPHLDPWSIVLGATAIMCVGLAIARPGRRIAITALGAFVVVGALVVAAISLFHL